jgi:hypothetical protein
MRRLLRATLALVLIGSILACSGEFGYRAGQIFPFLRQARPELNYPPVDCDKELDLAPAPKGCITKTIECGDEIDATNEGGAREFDDEFYQVSTFAPFGANYGDSPEVVYQLKLGPHTHADLTLVSPCADLDLGTMLFEGKNGGLKGCPVPRGNHQDTNMSVSETAVDTIAIETTKPSGKKLSDNYLVIVDGKKGDVGNFRLDVKCYQK